MQKSQWAGDKAQQLDSTEFVIKGMGLSVLSKKEKDEEAAMHLHAREEGIRVGVLDSTKSYASGAGKQLRIEVAFPTFNTRNTDPEELQQVKEKLRETCSEAQIEQVFALCDQVYWRNIQNGRHPLLPKEMVLVRQNSFEESDTKVIQYVPKVLLDIYKAGL